MAMAPTITGNALSAPAAPAAARPRSGAAWLAAAMLAVLGLTTAGISARSLTIVAASADLTDLAASIEQGAHSDAAYLASVVGADSFARDGDDCSDAVTRARLTVAWAAMDALAADAQKLQVVEAGAMRAALRRLACDPLDGGAWLRTAMIAERGGAPHDVVDAALSASYRLAPAEMWVVESRLEFVTRSILAGSTAVSADYKADLQRFVAFESIARVAAAYVAAPSSVRGWLRPRIDAQPNRRRREILIGIDRLGVDYAREAP